MLEVKQGKRKTNTENTIFLDLQCNPHLFIPREFVFPVEINMVHTTIT